MYVTIVQYIKIVALSNSYIKGKMYSRSKIRGLRWIPIVFVLDL